MPMATKRAMMVTYLKWLLPMHCTAVFRRCMADESGNCAVCTADLSVKIKWRNIETIIVEHILNSNWHIFKTNLVLAVSSCLFCVIWMFPVMRFFCSLHTGWLRNIFPSYWKWFLFYKFSVSISDGEALVFSLSVISVILERQSTNRQCLCLILFWLFQPCLLHIFLLFDLNYIEWRNRRKWFCFLKSIPSAF